MRMRKVKALELNDTLGGSDGFHTCSGRPTHWTVRCVNLTAIIEAMDERKRVSAENWTPVVVQSIPLVFPSAW
jgi:hypothetical protein